MGPIEVFVLAAPGRDEAHQRCYESIEDSDIGKRYVVCENPPNVEPREHWRATLSRAAAARSDLVLVLEDDCVVNRHILYNCRTWKWPRDAWYGAGWLYKPGGFLDALDDWYTKGLDWYGTVAVLYRTELLSGFVEAAWKWLQRENSNAWDIAISAGVLRGGYGIRSHKPSLAEHLWHVPSKLRQESSNPEADYYFRSSRGTFDENWKRPAGDRHGL